jgi:membrane-bound ClpP family serine protease
MEKAFMNSSINMPGVLFTLLLLIGIVLLILKTPWSGWPAVVTAGILSAVLILHRLD